MILLMQFLSLLIKLEVTGFCFQSVYEFLCTDTDDDYTKQVYVVGGVGDKKYYNDTWVLDTTISSWSKLEICGQPPQGRFSHTAIVTDSDIAIYGGLVPSSLTLICSHRFFLLVFTPNQSSWSCLSVSLGSIF